MPSPFPGMDPYLEAPDIWPGVHHLLASQICFELNRVLPRPYYSDVEMRPELGIVEEWDETGPAGPGRRIVPDVLLLKYSEAAGALAVAEPHARDFSPSVEFGALPDEPVRHFTVEIRDSKRGHKLITLIEILSPSNKRPGPDRQSYQEKQREIIESDVNLVEIDLLRAGRRVYATPDLEEAVGRVRPSPQYLVMVSRSWLRIGPTAGTVGYPFSVRDPLPCIRVPLKSDLPPVRLDLQLVFDRVYDGGPYHRGAVDYSGTPEPPLTGADAQWAAERARAARVV